MVCRSIIKLNFVLNHSTLIMVSIYISNLRRRIAGEAFHLAISHRLGMTQNLPKTGHAWFYWRVVGNTPYLSTPAPKFIGHTISDATLFSVWPMAVKTIDISSI